MEVTGLVSGGKDNCFSMMWFLDYGHKVIALANLTPSMTPSTSSTTTCTRLSGTRSWSATPNAWGCPCSAAESVDPQGEQAAG